MPLHFETEKEREALAAAWGDRAAAGAASIDGEYDEPQGEELLVEGTAPTFRALGSRLMTLGVTRGSIIDSVTTHDGRTRGPFKVVRWSVEDDGVFVVLGLEQQ